MTPTGLTRDAGWEIGVSRSFPVPLHEAWAVLTSPEGLAAWLGPGAELPTAPKEPYALADGTTGELRSLRPHDRIRLTLRPPGRDAATTVQVVVRPNATGTSVRFHQERLDDATEREAQRRHWSSVLDRLADLLGG